MNAPAEKACRKCNLESLVLKHSEEISTLQNISGQMMLLWKIAAGIVAATVGTLFLAIADYLIRLALS